ncbi:MAG: hypothetical protein LBK75_09440 [Oscillospiraceae bacterium]|nr:hypothetical protein [Oscillospiraceae bacterium]
MSQNVMIPLKFVDTMIELLGHWDISKHPPVIRYNYDDVLCALKMKKWKCELHDAYSKIIQAYDQQTRDEARIYYLRLKNRFVYEKHSHL